MTEGVTVYCPACKTGSGLPEGRILDLTTGVPLNCYACKNSAEAFDFFSYHLLISNPLVHPSVLLAGRSTIFALVVEQGRLTVLDLDEAGIPEDARVFRVVCSPYSDESTGAMVPMFGLTVLGTPGVPRKIPFTLVAANGDQVRWGKTVASFAVAWSPAGGVDECQDLLASAMVAFGDGDYMRAALDADAAFDRITRPVVKWLKSYGLGSERNMGALQRFSFCLALAEARGLPKLSRKVIENIGSLRASRHSSAHGGKLADDTKELASGIAAALLTVWYFGETLPVLMATEGST